MRRLLLRKLRWMYHQLQLTSPGKGKGKGREKSPPKRQKISQPPFPPKGGNDENRPSARDLAIQQSQSAEKPPEHPKPSSLPHRPASFRGGFSGSGTLGRGAPVALTRGRGRGRGVLRGQGIAADDDIQKQNTRPPWRP
jgi:hypothetical protein